MAKNLSLTPHERYNPHHTHCTVHHVCQRARICAWGPSRTQQTHRRSCSFVQAGSARRAPTSQQPDLTRDARHTYSTECACMAHCPRHSPVTFMWWVDHGVDKNPTFLPTVTPRNVCPSHRKNLSLGLSRRANMPKNLSLSQRLVRS